MIWSPQLLAACTARHRFQGFAEAEAACSCVEERRGQAGAKRHCKEGAQAPPAASPAHWKSASSGFHPGLSCLPTVIWLWDRGHLQSPPLGMPHQRPETSQERFHTRREAQTSRACWQEGLCPWTPQCQQTRPVLRQGLNILLWDHTALGVCEPGAEPEPGTLVGQAFLSPIGVWTKTYNQRDRGPLIHPIHVGFCHGRA